MWHTLCLCVCALGGGVLPPSCCYVMTGVLAPSLLSTGGVIRAVQPSARWQRSHCWHKWTHLHTHKCAWKCTNSLTLHSAITWLSHVCAYFAISQSPCYANKRVENVAEWECGSNGRLSSSPRASVFSVTSPTSYTLNFNLSWQNFNSLTPDLWLLIGNSCLFTGSPPAHWERMPLCPTWHAVNSFGMPSMF